MRIFILGGPGSGKTTIAKKISEKYSIPFYELDKLFYNPETKESIDKEEDREKIIEQFINKEDWISEGVYRQKWLDRVLERSDFVYSLKVPKHIRNWRTTKRTIRQMLGIEGYRPASLKLIFDFFKLNDRFEKERCKEIDSRLKDLGIVPIVIRSLKEIDKHIFGQINRNQPIK